MLGGSRTDSSRDLERMHLKSSGSSISVSGKETTCGQRKKHQRSRKKIRGLTQNHLFFPPVKVENHVNHRALVRVPGSVLSQYWGKKEL